MDENGDQKDSDRPEVSNARYHFLQYFYPQSYDSNHIFDFTVFVSYHIEACIDIAFNVLYEEDEIYNYGWLAFCMRFQTKGYYLNVECTFSLLPSC